MSDREDDSRSDSGGAAESTKYLPIVDADEIRGLPNSAVPTYDGALGGAIVLSLLLCLTVAGFIVACVQYADIHSQIGPSQTALIAAAQEMGLAIPPQFQSAETAGIASTPPSGGLSSVLNSIMGQASAVQTLMDDAQATNNNAVYCTQQVGQLTSEQKTLPGPTRALLANGWILDGSDPSYFYIKAPATIDAATGQQVNLNHTRVSAYGSGLCGWASLDVVNPNNGTFAVYGVQTNRNADGGAVYPAVFSVSNPSQGIVLTANGSGPGAGAGGLATYSYQVS